MTGFAMIFGQCMWVPPSPKAALVALGLFFGVGVSGEPDVAADEALIADQYVAVGKTQAEAEKEVARLNACFASYEVRPEKRTGSAEAEPNTAANRPRQR